MKTISIQISRENYQALQGLYTMCSGGHAHALAGLLDQLRPCFPVPIVLPETFGSVVTDDTGEVYVYAPYLLAARSSETTYRWINTTGHRVSSEWLAEQPGAKIRRRGALGPQEIGRC